MVAALFATGGPGLSFAGQGQEYGAKIYPGARNDPARKDSAGRDKGDMKEVQRLTAGMQDAGVKALAALDAIDHLARTSSPQSKGP